MDTQICCLRGTRQPAGYITLVMHSPEKLKTFMFVSTNDQHHNVSRILDYAAQQFSN